MQVGLGSQEFVFEVAPCQADATIMRGYRKAGRSASESDSPSDSETAARSRAPRMPSKGSRCQLTVPSASSRSSLKRTRGWDFFTAALQLIRASSKMPKAAEFCRICGHNVHADCRRRWAAASGQSSCPTLACPGMLRFDAFSTVASRGKNAGIDSEPRMCRSPWGISADILASSCSSLGHWMLSKGVGGFHENELLILAMIASGTQARLPRKLLRRDGSRKGAIFVGSKACAVGRGQTLRLGFDAPLCMVVVGHALT